MESFVGYRGGEEVELKPLDDHDLPNVASLPSVSALRLDRPSEEVAMAAAYRFFESPEDMDPFSFQVHCLVVVHIVEDNEEPPGNLIPI